MQSYHLDFKAITGIEKLAQKLGIGLSIAAIFGPANTSALGLCSDFSIEFTDQMFSFAKRLGNQTFFLDYA